MKTFGTISNHFIIFSHFIIINLEKYLHYNYNNSDFPFYLNYYYFYKIIIIFLSYFLNIKKIK